MTQIAPNKNHRACDRHSDKRPWVMSHKCIRKISDEIRGENKNSEPAAPLRVSGEPNRSQCTSDADDHHQQNRQPTNPLKSSMRFRIQSPKRIESTAGDKSSQMVKAHMQAPKAKKSASNFIPIGLALFIKGPSSACSVSGSRRLPLIVQLALRRPHFHPSFARPKIISGYKFL